MREGFHWDASNVIKEEGYIEYGKGPRSVKNLASAATRWYFLTDTDQPRRWIASLDVRAFDAKILYNFDLSRLSRELVRTVWASNQDKQQIYGYQSYTPPDKSSDTTEILMTGFNMIYDKMPMEGFWPWPRKENEATGADTVLCEGSLECHLFTNITTTTIINITNIITNTITTIITNIINIIIMMFQFPVDIITILSNLIKYIIDLRPLVDLVSSPGHHQVNDTAPPATMPLPVGASSTNQRRDVEDGWRDEAVPLLDELGLNVREDVGRQHPEEDVGGRGGGNGTLLVLSYDETC
ncbi:hypothetical protein E0Z10_g1479 [Xylaria hypoxylon]|uniref:Uncharacterized protein n=1 Tax=Xylaria hypoxylon TaxID=37992 RepID=A0A4Z0YSA1_9PEZI|nr:hypothetical protein E0Z10_g1479 [Xylaria hypoxylon]